MFFIIISKKTQTIYKKLPGFSIIEMMIVLVIIGIIATLSISTLNNALLKAKIKAAQIQAYNLSRSLNIYKLQFGEYPDEKEGWNLLINPPDGIQLLEKIPVDPWQNQYIYIYILESIIYIVLTLFLEDQMVSFQMTILEIGNLHRLIYE